jgi:hypothetical protein
MLLVSTPAIAVVIGFVRHPSAHAISLFGWMLVLPLIPLAFAMRFRVSFTRTDFVYRRWGPTARVPYDQIASIEVTNQTPITKQPIGAFIVTQAGARIPFWPKLFPRAAVERFFALAS